MRAEVEARLKRKGVFADASFSREILRMPVDEFVEFLDDMVDDTTKRDLRKRLVVDHQMPDPSFKALVAGLLGKVAERVAGRAGEAIAGELVEPFGDLRIEDAAGRLTTFLAHLLRRESAAAAAFLRGAVSVARPASKFKAAKRSEVNPECGGLRESEGRSA